MSKKEIKNLVKEWKPVLQKLKDSDNQPMSDIDKELAIDFHNTYERLAPSFGYETREDTKNFDSESKNGKLMIAVCHEINGQFKQLIIKEFKLMWNKTQPDIVPEGTPLTAEAAYIKQRIEEWEG